MDTDGFRLATISEKSYLENEKPSIKSEVSGVHEHSDITVSSIKQNSTSKVNSTMNQLETYSQHEVTSIPDDDDDYSSQRKIASKQPSQISVDQESTMVSSYTTGDDNDVIEIHQFTLGDIDVYLDIYFETLSHRLRHYIGDDEQLQQFRTSVKNRINSDSNAPEFRNVLLGKINGEILAAVTILFVDETPTIPLIENYTSQRNSCLTPLRRWMIRKANYVPKDVAECYVEMMGVKNAFQNQGIGSAMLECVEYIARQAGANLLTIHVSGPELVSYFIKRGFVTGRGDAASFWKWIIERQSFMKLSKALLPTDDDFIHGTDSYINESMVDSAE